MIDRPKKDDAQAQFKKLQRAEDGKKAMAEYEAENLAIRAKTERLKAASAACRGSFILRRIESSIASLG